MSSRLQKIIVTSMLTCLLSTNSMAQDSSDPSVDSNFVLPAPATFNDDAPVDELARRVKQLEAEVQSLKGAQQTFLPAEYEENPDQIDCPHCVWAPEFPTVQFTGFFQIDALFFSQDSANIAALGDIDDVWNFRRARFAGQGKVAENIDYILEVDFAFVGRPSFMDVDFDIHDVPYVGNIRVGHWRQPFSMDALTSVKEMLFLERALPFAFFPFRQIGAGAYNTAFDERMTWAVSGYKFPVDPFGGNRGDRGYGTSTRITLLPYLNEHRQKLIHLGFGYSFNSPSTKTIRYANFPEVGALVQTASGVATNIPFFVDTMAISANNSNLFGVEAAAQAGPAYIQSELMYAVVDQIGGPTLVFPGMYVQAAYTLTGEVRPYKKASGIFGRVTPYENFGRCGWGAWELGARWSYIDLNDHNIAGGRLNNLTFGLNWYLNQFTKFNFDYMHAFLDDPTAGKGNADIVAIRAQVDF